MDGVAGSLVRLAGHLSEPETIDALVKLGDLPKAAKASLFANQGRLLVGLATAAGDAQQAADWVGVTSKELMAQRSALAETRIQLERDRQSLEAEAARVNASANQIWAARNALQSCAQAALTATNRRSR